MLDIVLVFFSLLWFFNTEYFELWKAVKIGGDQFCISLTALIILIYVTVGLFSGVRWYYIHRRY